MSELRQVYTVVDARDRIVDAALSVFSQQGYAGSTMRVIAQTAGVSSGLIHHHFKDKESLWNLVGERISDDFLEAVSKDADLEDPSEALRRVMANYQQYWREHPRALKFQLWRVLGAPEEERALRSKLLNEFFVPKVKRAQDAGVVRGDVSPGLAMLTVGGLVQYFLHSDIETRDAIGVTGDEVPDDATMLNYLLELISARRETTVSSS